MFVSNTGERVSIQDDINYVKKELSADEKVLESALKIETLYNKYKMLLWGALGAGIIAFAGSAIVNTMDESRLESANQALLTLQKNPKDSEALTTLKAKNPELFDLYNYSLAVKAKDEKSLKALASNKNELLADVSSYHSKVLANAKGDSQYYKDLSLIEAAYSDIEAGKGKEARLKLDTIDARSSLASIAQLLKHYTIKGE